MMLGMTTTKRRTSRAKKPRSTRPDWCDRFLVAYGATNRNIAGAARAAEISRSTVYDHIRKHPSFREEMGDAHAGAKLEAELVLWRLAVKGTPKRTYYHGEVVDETTEHNVALLLRWLAISDPSKYRVEFSDLSANDQQRILDDEISKIDRQVRQRLGVTDDVGLRAVGDDET
jgi:hypothetical protein